MSEGKLRQWPCPGVLSMWLSWPSAPPPITVEDLGYSSKLLVDLAGECSLVVLSARGEISADKFASFVERLRASFRANRQLFVHAAWAAQLAKNSVDPARCGDVTMETMHAALIQFACNIAEWQDGPQSPPVAESLEALRRYLARDSFNLPASQTRFDPGAPTIDLPAVALQLRAESALGRRLLIKQRGTVTDDAWLSPADIAGQFTRLTTGAVSKRLERWRSKNRNADGWREVTERKPREPQYLYRWGSVKQLFSPSVKTSGERRAK